MEIDNWAVGCHDFWDIVTQTFKMIGRSFFADEPVHFFGEILLLNVQENSISETPGA